MEKCERINMASSKAALLLTVLNITLFSLFVSSTKVVCPPTTPTVPSVPTPSVPSHPTFPTKPAKCPKDTLKFGVCGSWLGLVHEVIGTPPSKECCTLISGLADAEAALCLCTAIKANVLGVVKIKAPVAVSLVVNACGKKIPKGFKCA
uniref:Bifunctional inhibitor/plant lipid transfer protein/seed storage helical domain-containing protein n=1 Tax=Kalanchoe fedtschenkoi TaxID=63787 RepID=A0A7N0ZTQ4_KALFE